MRAITYCHKTTKAAALVAIAVGALMAAIAARADEGWDPLKQVTSQIAHPNLMVVLDVSGSMAWSPVSDSVQPGVDSFGLPDWSWTTTGPVSSSSGCTSGKKTYTWTFTLTQKDIPYSRMDAFKNALGNSVPLYGSFSGTNWVGPTITWPTTWPYTYSGYVYTGGGTWTWTSACAGSQPSTPSSPFTPSWTTPDYSQSPPVTAKLNCGSGKTCEPASISPITLPQDVVGNNKDKVNWGFEIFSEGFSFKDYTGTTASRNAHILVMPKADDTPATQADKVALIEPYLKPKALGGLGSYNGTATSAALNTAKFGLNYCYTHAGTNGSSNDPQALCGRVYGTVLVTDGASNTCNPSGNEQSCSSSVPSTWKSYPEGRTDELFLEQKDQTSGCATSDQTPIPSRTFVIGVSTSVSRCELNLDAFMGRTDASSPNGDAGMAIDKDYTGSAYRLPLNVSTDFKTVYYTNRGITFPAALTVSTTTTKDNYKTNGGDYAYFATSASALYNAFVAIIGAAGAGDYSMSAPVVSGNVVNSGSTAYVCSMAYPAMQGHVYAYDLSQCNTLNCTLSNPTCDSCTGTADNPKPAPRTPVLLWDAGQVLANSVIGADHTSGRSIWTWDPSTTALVEVTQQQQNLNKLQSINPSVTANVVDFIRGNNGTGTKRAWLLGPIINSTAAIVSAPQWWTGKNNIPSHAAFENLYAKNHPLLMVGSSDGMMHFFDVADGAEVLALLPPDQLAHQVTLYNNYKSGGATATGEPQDLSQHVFGVASSPRFADVYSATDSTYHTELLLTEGPGGRALSAIDITHPYPARTGVVVPYVDGKDATTQVPILKTKTEDFDADKNYDASAPVSVLWHKDGAFNYSSLGQTWSVPAVGITAFDATNPSFRAVLGSGYSATATPALLLLDAVTGAEKENYPLSSASGLVHNQSYGAGVLFNNTAVKNLADDKLNLGLVCDAYGNVYGVDPVATPTASQLFSADAVNHYPLYYTPAVGYYDSWDIYAYATGNFYEKSTNVTGANTTFEPYVYIRLKDPLGVQSDRFVGFKISDFQYCSANCDSKTPTMSNVPKSAQITADPILFLPANSTPDSTKPVLAYFVFYDPNPALGCGGMSFLVKVSLDMSKLNGTGSNLSESLTTASSSLGTGAASGISFSGGQVIVAKSAVGQGSAGISSTGENGPDVIAGAPQITSWKELQ